MSDPKELERMQRKIDDDRLSLSDDKTWRAIAMYGIEEGARRAGVSEAQALSVLERQTRRQRARPEVAEQMRTLGLAHLDAMMAPQLRAAIGCTNEEADGKDLTLADRAQAAIASVENVKAVLEIMKMQQTLLPGLKVPMRQELTGAGGKPMQHEVKTLDADGADALMGALLKDAGRGVDKG